MSEQVKRLVDESGKNAYWNRYKYEKTGNLVIEIDSVGGAGPRKTWADGKVQRLEDILGNFIKTLHQWMNRLEEHRLDDECRARQRQAAADRRRRVQEKQEAEKKRREHLHALVEQWQKAKSVQSFLEALERACNRDDDQRIEVSSEWLDWIRWYGEYLCPLTKTPARNEFIERPENTEIGELQFTKETSEYMKHAPYRDTDELHAAGHDTVAKLFGHHSWSAMREVRDVLEGLGYDVQNYGHAFY